MNGLDVHVYRDGREVGSRRFPGKALSIGRGSETDIQLADTAVSRKHVDVRVTPRGLVHLRDLGSRNGVLVNGERVDDAVIGPYDRVQIGRFELRFLRTENTSDLETYLFDNPDPETALNLVDEDKQRGESGAFRLDDPDLTPPPRPTAPTMDAQALEFEPELPWLGLEHVEDLADADLDILPPFSLAEEIRNRPAPAVAVGEPIVLEVVTCQSDRIVWVEHVAPGRAVEEWDEASTHHLAWMDELGDAFVTLPPGAEGTAYSAHEQNVAHVSGGQAGSTYRVQPSWVYDISKGDRTWYLRMVPASEAIDEDINLGEELPKAGYLVGLGGVSMVGHLLLLFFVLPALMAVLTMFEPPAAPADAQPDRFAVVDRVTPTPEPPATPTPPPEATPTPPPRKQVAEVVRKKRPRPQDVVPPQNASPETTAQTAVAGITGALGKVDIKMNSGAPLLAAATNLKAMRVPGGGGYKVSAIAVKADGVVAGRPGGAFGSEDVGTVNGQILNAKGGAGGIQKKTGGKVRGQVAAPPARAVAVQGHLDRAQIAKVVNKHLHQVRHCYEKALLRDPGLAGKVLMEWKIGPDGRVTEARTQYSSLRGGGVSGCIASRIRTWQFPPPKGGGNVQVRYPFLFESVGF